MKKILIDTDIGDDIDDLIALYLAINMSEAEIVGVTTSFKNTALRARQVKKALALKGIKNIPVYSGMGKPLCGLRGDDVDSLFSQFTPDLYANDFKPDNQNESSESYEASEFIVQMARQYGKDLTIVELAPETNLALAIRIDPKIMQEVNIYLMGGSYFKAFKEWNIECDYKAAGILFASSSAKTCFGLDVTLKTKVDDKTQKEFLAERKDGFEGYLLDCIRLWVGYTKKQIVLHDPLAMYCVFHPEICTYTKKHVCVETDGSYSKALTLLLEDLTFDKTYTIFNKNSSLCDIAQTVKSDEFVSIIRNILRI